MLSRRTGPSTNGLALILGLITPLLVLVILILLLIIWRWKLYSKARSKPTPRHLNLLGAHSKKYFALNSALSSASTFDFPKKNSENTPTDFKVPFRFPTPLTLAAFPPLSSQAQEFTASRVYIAPPTRKADMDKSPMPSTQFSPVSYDDPEGWTSSSYAGTLPDSRPSSYSCTPSSPRSHSPASHPMPSESLRQPGLFLSTPYANSGTRPTSQIVDDSVSIDVDSLYVESHDGGDRQAIMSVAPQIPPIYFGAPFRAFANLEGEAEEGTVDCEKIGESAATLERVRNTYRKHREKPVGKNRRMIPAGWF